MPTINFRMDEEQHAELQASARAAGRSLQAELSWRAFAHYPVTRHFDPTRAGGPVVIEVPEEVLDEVRAVEIHPSDFDGAKEWTSDEPTPAPSVPPAPVPARTPRMRRPKNGPCPHRVPEGTYCKQCGA